MNITWPLHMVFSPIWDFIKTTVRGLFSPPRLVLPPPVPPPNPNEPDIHYIPEEPVVTNMAITPPASPRVHCSTQDGAFGGARRHNGIKWRARRGMFE
jgi:hypothetical protein